MRDFIKVPAMFFTYGFLWIAIQDRSVDALVAMILPIVIWVWAGTTGEYPTFDCTSWEKKLAKEIEYGIEQTQKQADEQENDRQSGIRWFRVTTGKPSVLAQAFYVQGSAYGPQRYFRAKSYSINCGALVLEGPVLPKRSISVFSSVWLEDAPQCMSAGSWCSIEEM